MLSALALASSLWLAGQESGARPDAAGAVVVPVEVEKIADESVRDVAWVVGSHSVDLLFTAAAIERCNGACAEGNPIGFNPEARMALKMAQTASTALTLWKLRRDGHGRAATIVRWATVAINAGFAVNNAVHAIRRR